MKKAVMNVFLTMLLSMVSASLIASPVAQTVEKTTTLENESKSVEPKQDDALAKELKKKEKKVEDEELEDLEMILESSEDSTSPFEDDEVYLEETQTTALDSESKDTEKVQKILYDPKMNYGTGAPVPKPAPISTKKRNLIVLAASVILATTGMLVVSSNNGRDAPSGTSH